MTGQLNLNDESTHAERGAQIVRQTTIINDHTAKWLVIVLLSFAAAFAVVESLRAVDDARRAQQAADLARYYTIDLEVYLYKQGLTPPRDPWTSRPKKEPGK